MNTQAMPKSYVNAHAAILYRTLAERMQLLAQYFKEGLAANEYCVFVTPGPAEQAVIDFQTAGLDVREAVANGTFRINEMYRTYMPNGVFSPSTMLGTVTDIIADFETQNYNGVRAAGEMRWINVHPRFLPSATTYEENISKLCASRHDFEGICLYPVIPGALRILKSALSTHPTVAYDGKLRANPFAQAGEDALHNIRSTEELSRQLDLLVA